MVISPSKLLPPRPLPHRRCKLHVQVVMFHNGEAIRLSAGKCLVFQTVESGLIKPQREVGVGKDYVFALLLFALHCFTGPQDSNSLLVCFPHLLSTIDIIAIKQGAGLMLKQKEVFLQWPLSIREHVVYPLPQSMGQSFKRVFTSCPVPLCSGLHPRPHFLCHLRAFLRQVTRT